MSQSFSASLAFAALLGLAACGGQVASDAPALMSMEEIAASADIAADTSRGVAAANTLESRGARLRARAAQIRRAGIASGERQELLYRAEQLKSR
ncbi:hypothetical protein [Pararhodobacter sp.]|uniref:hypothetical protein n=1 Tax=Pararhodobacter sp. TaxID=2127056 RepID=UPI002B001A70|nr:hypothetical protein [Pararhodobacter sp.]